MKYFLDQLVLLLATISALISNVAAEKCDTLQLSETEIKQLRSISENLDTFLQRNVRYGQQNLRKVMEAFGSIKASNIKFDDDAPLASVLLQEMLLVHRDLKTMHEDMKHLMTRAHLSKLPREKNEVTPSLRKSESGSSSPLDASGRASGKSLGEWVSDTFYATDYKFRPTDCADVLVGGNTKSRVYEIFPFRCQCSPPVKAFCDMETDGGGWTVFLSRVNTSKPLNFTRNWDDFRNGFGDAEYDYWLGNEVLHLLTYSRNYILRMEARDDEGRSIWGEWKIFKVDSEELKYKLTATTYNSKSTAYDRFSYVTGQYFTTFDRDYDKNAKNCAQLYQGGWWFNNCNNNHYTGVYGKRDNTGMKISPWSKVDKSIRYASWIQLKIRPTVCSNLVSVAKFNVHNCAFNY